MPSNQLAFIASSKLTTLTYPIHGYYPDGNIGVQEKYKINASSKDFCINTYAFLVLLAISATTSILVMIPCVNTISIVVSIIMLAVKRE
jgi:hypothetical protein